MTDTYLPSRDVPWQVSMPRAAGSVQSLATTATVAWAHGNQEWMGDLEYVWRVRVAGELARLDARARRRRRQARALEGGERVKALRSAEWAEHRARSLALARADVVASCNRRWRTVACGCGHREFPVGCKQPQLCATCRKTHWKRWNRRITLAMDAALRDERAAWYRDPNRTGMRPGIYLLTLTAPHSGDLETDRRTMGVAVRALFKHATHRGWWRTYALTWEVTPGSLDDGHLHAHLAVISAWVPYKKLHNAWRAAMPGARVLDVQPPRRGTDEASRAAGYLAKYVTKGIEPTELTGRKAGEMLAAFRGRRKVTTSRHFWIPPVNKCPCCEQRWRQVRSPTGLQHVVPGAVLRSRAERMGWWIPRGGPQVLLRFDSG